MGSPREQIVRHAGFPGILEKEFLEFLNRNLGKGIPGIPEIPRNSSEFAKSCLFWKIPVILVEYPGFRCYS